MSIALLLTKQSSKNSCLRLAVSLVTEASESTPKHHKEHCHEKIHAR
jgi:hypothetical protein